MTYLIWKAKKKYTGGASSAKDLFNSILSLFCFACFHENFGLNKVVSMSDSLFLFLSDFTKIKGTCTTLVMGSCSNLHYKQNVWSAVIVNHQLDSLCPKISYERLIVCFYEIACVLKARINPLTHRLWNLGGDAGFEAQLEFYPNFYSKSRTLYISKI